MRNSAMTQKPRSQNYGIHISEEVRASMAAGKPVVALESTIISHGMPYPQNVETALSVEQVIRDAGAVPATIAILQGKPIVGMSADEIEYLGRTGQAVIKTSRRDIPFVMAMAKDGATTVASTMIFAAKAGIAVFATGGIGGVHRDAQQTFDVSADLQELATTNVAVVCAGAKSILDIALTREYLETQGVPIVGYQTNTLPAFYTRESDFSVDYRLEHPAEIATAMQHKWQLGIDGGLVIANPIPEAYALSRTEMDSVIEKAISAMNAAGVQGKESTPFLLAKVAEMTGGDSLAANIQLVKNNAKLASAIALDYAALNNAN